MMKSLTTFFLAVLASAMAIPVIATAQEPMPSISQRFAPNPDGSLASNEVPDFQKHISPLLGRLGCNGRACHGSFQGQGGFMLSLFGYDFDVDHKALLDADRGRVNLKEPLESLILTKPTDADMHEGGKRFDKSGWEYQVLKSWIEAGAPKANQSKSNKEDLKLESLNVSPREITFDVPGQTHAIKAVALWSDGTREDVTTLSRFFSNDSAIAQVDDSGLITAGDRGDTHIVVSYDNAVVPIAVLRPSGPSGLLQDAIARAPSEIDRLVLTKLDKLGVQPSVISDDAEFFRRVSLDIAGTLPTSDQVRAFLKDTNPEKRQIAIDKLLNSPGYAALWTTFFCDITGNNEDQLRNASYLQTSPSLYWYQWIYDRIERNVPYDQIVEGIVTAVSREPGESYRDFCDKMTEIANDTSGKKFAERSHLAYYWARNNQASAEERAISFAYAFCGVRIQCAQCHKHPFDQWSKKDFEQFERLFDGIVGRQGTLSPEGKKEFDKIIDELNIPKASKGNQLQKAIRDAYKPGEYTKTMPFPEVLVQLNRDKKNKDDKKDKKQAPPKPVMAKLLGGDHVDLAKVPDPRQPLMEWLRGKENPYFAKALVNRVWAHYFQTGIVNPVDDLNLANAPSNEALLNFLADGFVANNYDLKWLHRTIVHSDTYQRTWRTNASNELDRRNFSHALLRRLPAETAYDALRIALSSDRRATALCNLEEDRAMTLPGASAQNRNKGSSYALSVFGRSIRESNCDCDRTSDPSLLQTVFIRNDSDVLQAMIDPEKSWLAQVAKERGWPIPNARGVAPKQSNTANLDMMASNDSVDKDEKLAETLDKEARAAKIKLERLTSRSAPEDKLREAKSQLARSEKKLAEHLASMADKAKEREGHDALAEADKDSQAQSSFSINDDLKQLIEEAYIRTLSRQPTAEESHIAARSLSDAATPISGLSDLLWALINSKEFILNH
jgi:hypothetical protein